MRKTISFVLTMTMSFTLYGCNSSKESSVVEDVPTPDTTVEEDVKGEGVMTYEEYVAAEVGSQVTIETYVQDKTALLEDNGVGQTTLYTQDHDGAYLIYDISLTSEQYDQLNEGTKIKVIGTKDEWCGEIDVINATFEIEEGSYVAKDTDVTEILSNQEQLIQYQNQKVIFTGLKVVAAQDGSENAFLYKWDGTGSEGDNLYFNVTDGNATYTFVADSYLRGTDTDVYKAVQNLKIGDTVNCEGYLYWFEGAYPHIIYMDVK